MVATDCQIHKTAFHEKKVESTGIRKRTKKTDRWVSVWGSSVVNRRIQFAPEAAL